MKEIFLTKGMVSFVDDEDYDVLNNYNWCILQDKNNFYAGRRDGRKFTQMHRKILGLKFGDKRQVDHIDGNGLNNQKSNLRIVNISKNLMNMKKRNNCSSIYKGVYWQEIYQKWCAQIRVNCKRKTIGRFKEEIEAAHAYDIAAIKFFGDFARLNFPVENKISCIIKLAESPTLIVNNGSRCRIDNISGYRGVGWHKKTSKWQVRVKEKYIGCFDHAIDAAYAYGKAAIKEYGQLAKLNFPAGLI